MTVGSTTALAVPISINGDFSKGTAGWTFVGPATVVDPGGPGSDPFGRVNDGALSLLYQEFEHPGTEFSLSFDFFTGLMSDEFASPGAFPDTVFASLYFGSSVSALEPESFLYDNFLGLFDFDAANGFQTDTMLPGASIGASSVRDDWLHFEGTFSGFSGLPAFAVTFQNLDGNGTPGDSAFLVDNLQVASATVPDAGSSLLLLSMAGILVGVVRWRTRT